VGAPIWTIVQRHQRNGNSFVYPYRFDRGHCNAFATNSPIDPAARHPSVEPARWLICTGGTVLLSCFFIERPPTAQQVDNLSEEVQTLRPAMPNPDPIRWENAACAVCGSSTSSFIVEVSNFIYDRRGAARIVRCEDCRHVYQSPRPTRDTISHCYTADYGPHTHNLSPALASDQDSPPPQTSRWYLTPIVRSIPGIKSLYHWLSAGSEAPLPPPPVRDAKALEVGCGSGGYLQRLREAGWQVEGIEFAADPARRCRELGFRVHTTGIEDADLQPAAYDLVVAWMVVEHLHDPGSVLAQMNRLLRPDGNLMISVPNIDCWELRWFGRYNFILNEPTHLQHFSVASIGRLLAASGFEVESIDYQKNVYNLVGSIGIWLKSRFPNRKWGNRLLAFCDNPSMWGRLALAPLAKLIAALKQSGRITIIAKPRRSLHVSDTADTRP